MADQDAAQATREPGTSAKGRTAGQEKAAEGLGERLQKAYRTYSDELNRAWAPDEVHRRVAEEQRRYFDALQALQTGEVQDRAADAQAELARGLRDALSPEELGQDFEAAFRDYARRLREVWTATSPDEMDPATLLALAQAAHAGVALACQSAAAVQQRALALASMVPPEAGR